MNATTKPWWRTLLIAFGLACLLGGLFGSPAAHAQEAVIRKNLAERVPMMPKIDEVRKSAMPGLYELRVNGSDILYTDEQGNFLIQGSLFDTRARRNLTEERIDKLTAVDFATLPLRDAVTIVRGNGKRQIAVFEDPNCPYCKHFERDLQSVDNVTVHLFLIPILGGDSPEKARNVWCAKDRAGAWQALMLRGVAPPAAAASCDTGALGRNLAFAERYRITGTPTVFFSNGARVPGYMNAQQVEKLLADAK
ncbi:MAG: Thiol:disulfide interchange protein DsbC [Burkholderiaceae bacterium]|jgi:thiol:disulfide interchange protein DsbC|nr:MAG: Thiol:disulfide interchange protein DsbC [Burkholderiaceae bacterium]